jgi:hypothetical protein
VLEERRLLEAIRGLDERPEQFSGLDAGIDGHPTRRNLAALCQELGERAETMRRGGEVLDGARKRGRSARKARERCVGGAANGGM